MKTLHELNSTVWYRALKVFFCCDLYPVYKFNFIINNQLLKVIALQESSTKIT